MVKKDGYLEYLNDHTRHLFSEKTENKIAILFGFLAVILLLYKLFNDILPNIYKSIVLKKYRDIWKIFI
jgi:hypothetical protein